MPLSAAGKWFDDGNMTAYPLSIRQRRGRAFPSEVPNNLFTDMPDSGAISAWTAYVSRGTSRTRAVRSFERLDPYPQAMKVLASGLWQQDPQRPIGRRVRGGAAADLLPPPISDSWVIGLGLEVVTARAPTSRRGAVTRPAETHVVGLVPDFMQDNSGWLPSQSVTARRMPGKPAREVQDAPLAAIIDVAPRYTAAATIVVQQGRRYVRALGAAYADPQPYPTPDYLLSMTWESQHQPARMRQPVTARQRQAEDLSVAWYGALPLQYVSAWAGRPDARQRQNPIAGHGNAAASEVFPPATVSFGTLVAGDWMGQAVQPVRQNRRSVNDGMSEPVWRGVPGTIVVRGPYRVITADLWAAGVQAWDVLSGNWPIGAVAFSVVAPSTAQPGTAINVTVTAQDYTGATVSTYDGTVEITSSDSAATLPTSATLTSGVGVFSLTLNTVGTQTVTATDTVSSTLTGSDTVIVAVANLFIYASGGDYLTYSATSTDNLEYTS